MRTGAGNCGVGSVAVGRVDGKAGSGSSSYAGVAGSDGTAVAGAYRDGVAGDVGGATGVRAAVHTGASPIPNPVGVGYGGSGASGA